MPAGVPCAHPHPWAVTTESGVCGEGGEAGSDQGHRWAEPFPQWQVGRADIPSQNTSRNLGPLPSLPNSLPTGCPSLAKGTQYPPWPPRAPFLPSQPGSGPRGGPAPPTFSTLSQGNLAGLVSHLSNAPGRRAQPTGPGPPSTCCCPPASAPHHTRPCTAGLPVPAFSTPGPHCVTETLSPHSWMRILLHCSS